MVNSWCKMRLKHEAPLLSLSISSSKKKLFRYPEIVPLRKTKNILNDFGQPCLSRSFYLPLQFQNWRRHWRRCYFELHDRNNKTKRYKSIVTLALQSAKDCNSNTKNHNRKWYQINSSAILKLTMNFCPLIKNHNNSLEHQRYGGSKRLLIFMHHHLHTDGEAMGN